MEALEEMAGAESTKFSWAEKEKKKKSFLSSVTVEVNEEHSSSPPHPPPLRLFWGEWSSSQKPQSASFFLLGRERVQDSLMNSPMAKGGLG